MEKFRGGKEGGWKYKGGVRRGGGEGGEGVWGERRRGGRCKKKVVSDSYE
jgi:hypothetical protein